MSFDSLDFAIFLPIVFAVYWLVPRGNLRLQNGWIVAASYLFYGWWDWRFLSLILFSTSMDFLVGLGLMRQADGAGRKAILWLSVIVNLSFLGVFKYCNFFIDSFVQVFSFLGAEIQPRSLDIILPVGISFYTFQTLSYTIDVYRRRIEPTRSFVDFAAFVSFFPQLVAGPIERATHLLPQFQAKRVFDRGKAVDGLRQVLWGLFKKVVVADQCGKFADLIFNNSGDYSGSTLVFGALLFAFQIYGDFSGYSDIAIGTSRLFGFDLTRNFHFPYFSRDIAEFWRRWHISLSTWFRDYLYIPLGGSRGGTWNKVRNTFVVFVVSGFWHGASWTFVVWGLLHACYFLPLLLTNSNRTNLDGVAEGRTFPRADEFLRMLLTFGLTVFAWIFFRANSLEHAFGYISGMFSPALLDIPRFAGGFEILTVTGLVGTCLLVEWQGRAGQYAIEHLGTTWGRPGRYLLYYAIIAAIFWFGGNEQQFIYFQF
jgi:alginate O-acetyltransferase complex protein AlgI